MHIYVKREKERAHTKETYSIFDVGLDQNARPRARKKIVHFLSSHNQKFGFLSLSLFLLHSPPVLEVQIKVFDKITEVIDVKVIPIQRFQNPIILLYGYVVCIYVVHPPRFTAPSLWHGVPRNKTILTFIQARQAIYFISTEITHTHPYTKSK